MIKNIKILFEYTLVVLTIVSCNSVYMNMIGTNFNRIIVACYCINIVLLLFMNGLKIKALHKYFIFLVIYYAYLLMFYLINDIGTYSFEFVSYFVILLPLIVLYFLNISSEEIKKMLIKLKNTMLVLSVFSLFMYFLTNFNLITNYKYALVSWSATDSIPSVANLYFMPQGTVRNSLFFVEPAMYSIFLTLSMAIELMDKDKKINKILLLITIFTTTSTTGILLGILIFVIDYIKKSKKGLLFMILPFIVLIGILFAFSVFVQKTTSVSYQTRMDDYVACYKTWIEHPIFGSGFMNNNSIREHMSYFRKNNLGLSNSLFVVLAQGGIYLLFIYLIPIISILKNKFKQKEFLVGIVFLILLSTTIFHYTILAFSGVAIGISLMFNTNIYRKE